MPEPELGPLAAIIKPVVVSTCTTDVHLIQTMAMPTLKGKVIGHEMVGIVHEVGRDVKDFKPGDRVTAASVPPNWRSLEAQEGLSKFNTQGFYYSKDPRKGGVFAELCHVTDADMNLAHIPESVTWEQAIMLTDMVTTAFAGIDQLNLKTGDTVVILGIGPVGLMGVCGALMKGAGRVFGVGSRQVCFDVGKKYGVTDCINYKDGNIVDQILSKNGKPVDAVFVTGGSSSSIADGMRMVKYGGTVSNVACFFEDATTVIPSDVWNHGGLDKYVKGVMAEGGRAYMERLLSLVQYGRLKPELLVTHIFHGMEKIEDAIKMMADRDPTVIKPIIYFD